MTDEVWRPIPGHEGFYEASSHGRIRSVDREIYGPSRWGACTRKLKGKLIAGNANAAGYLGLRLAVNGAHRRVSVHQLVCEAFHGPKPSERHHVAHCDGDPRNNTADNLRWVTQSENEQDKRAHGTFPVGAARGHAKLTDSKVREIRRAQGESCKSLADKYGVTASTINNVLSGRSWTHVA